MEGFRIDQDYYVVKFTVPKKFVGYFVSELNLDEEFHLKMIGLKRAKTYSLVFNKSDVINTLAK